MADPILQILICDDDPDSLMQKGLQKAAKSSLLRMAQLMMNPFPLSRKMALKKGCHAKKAPEDHC